MAVGMTVGSWLSARSPAAPQAVLMRLDVELNSEGILGSDVGTDIILSPDGTRLVFVSRAPNGVTHLNLRRLDQSRSVELAGTESARSPFFAPDGRWIGFWAEGKLKKMSLDGGLPTVLCDSANGLGATWGPDGSIVANLYSTGVLSRIPSSGGAPDVIADLTTEAAGPVWPQFLPGGKNVLFTRLGAGGADDARIEILSLSDGERTVVLRGATYGRYLPNGYLVYVNQGTLFAAPFDLNRLVLQGTAFPILDDVSYSATFGYAHVDVSQTGLLVYRRSSGQAIAAWLDRYGRVERLRLPPGRYQAPRLSPDGRRLAMAKVASGASVTGIYDFRGEQPIEIGRGGIWSWSPDGRFVVGGGGPGSMVWMQVDYPETPRPLMAGGENRVPWSFSPDGRWLAYHEMGATTGFDVWTAPVETSNDQRAREIKVGVPKPFLQSPSFEVYPTFSPDGRWLAYGSNESGTTEVYVRAFPDNGTKVRVSDRGGRIPRWWPNGRGLLYRTDDQRLMTVTFFVENGRFIPGKPEPWTPLERDPRRLADTGVLPNFDLAPDGSRVLALLPSPEDQQTENHVTFLLNFFDEVQRRVASVTK
jgi:serine/threonine-protein kinase